MSRTQELQDLDANNNELDRLRLEASLIGASNRERAVAIAQLEASSGSRACRASRRPSSRPTSSRQDKANASV
jgi:cell division protein FtsL